MIGEQIGGPQEKAWYIGNLVELTRIPWVVISSCYTNNRADFWWRNHMLSLAAASERADHFPRISQLGGSFSESKRRPWQWPLLDVFQQEKKIRADNVGLSWWKYSARTFKFSVSQRWKMTENLHDDVEYRPSLQLGGGTNHYVSSTQHATNLKNRPNLTQ